MKHVFSLLLLAALPACLSNEGSSLTSGGSASGSSSDSEPALGNPSADGYVLTSTAAGVRSWSNLASSLVDTSSNQSAIAGNKTFTALTTIETLSLSALQSYNTGTTGGNSAQCIQPTGGIVRIVGTTATTTNGIATGTDGQILILVASNTATTGVGTNWTLSNNSAACGAGYSSIWTNNNGNLVSTGANTGAAFTLTYCASCNAWVVVTSSL